jgi:hypothetical protein
MLRILGSNPPQAACLGRSNAVNVDTHGKDVDSTNESIKIVLILSNIPTTVEVSISWLKALQLVTGKLLRQHMHDMLERQDEGDSMERRAARETQQ